MNKETIRYLAHLEMSSCCQTTCDQQHIKDYIEYLENRILELEKEKHNGSN